MKSIEELRQDVIDEIYDWRGKMWLSRSLVAALDALSAAQTPAEPARCEPPDWAKRERRHWLRHITEDKLVPAEWQAEDWALTFDDDLTPEEAFESGWRWDSVARPETSASPERPAVEITDAEIAAKWREIVRNDESFDQNAREIVRHFLVRASAAKPYVPMTDQEVVELWRSDVIGAKDPLLGFARAIEQRFIGASPAPVQTKTKPMTDAEMLTFLNQECDLKRESLGAYTTWIKNLIRDVERHHGIVGIAR